METQLPELNQPLPQPQSNHTPLLLASAVSGLLFLVLGFLLSRNFSSKQPRPITIPQAVVTPTPVWQTYTSPNLNFSIQFPATWYLNFETPSFEIATSPLDQYLHGVGRPPHGDYWFTISQTDRVAPDFSITTEEVGPNTTIINKNLYRKNGTTVLKITESYWSSNPPPTSIQTVFDQILTSFFKFNKSPTNNWKLYVDKEYHYSFKYPDSWGLGSVCEGDAEADLIRFGPQLLKFPASDCGTANLPSTVYFYVESTPSFYSGYNITEKKTQIIDNVKADYYLFRIKDRRTAGSTEYAQVVIPLKKQNLFLVGIVGQGHELSANKDIFDTILSTFQFTN